MHTYTPVAKKKKHPDAPKKYPNARVHRDRIPKMHTSAPTTNAPTHYYNRPKTLPWLVGWGMGLHEQPGEIEDRAYLIRATRHGNVYRCLEPPFHSPEDKAYLFECVSLSNRGQSLSGAVRHGMGPIPDF